MGRNSQRFGRSQIDRTTIAENRSRFTQTKSRTSLGRAKRSPKVKVLRNGLKVVGSAKITYEIISLLGQGGFGQVYKIREERTNKQFAMKTEIIPKEGQRIRQHLKTELAVLKKFSNLKESSRRHFVQHIDHGEVENGFLFIIMELVGRSLDSWRTTILRKDFSRSTAIRISQQTLEAIRDLHRIGFLHRDIKPQNFATGLDTKEDIIYMLDFGITRQYITGGVIRTPRTNNKFLGTITFASRSCHLHREQCRKDDLETWIYLSFDVFDRECLPWRRQRDKDSVCPLKQEFFDTAGEGHYKTVPKQYQEVIKYVDSLKYEDEPNYLKIFDILERIIQEAKIDIKKKLDWIGKLKETTPQSAANAEDRTHKAKLSSTRNSKK